MATPYVNRLRDKRVRFCPQIRSEYGGLKAFFQPSGSVRLGEEFWSWIKVENIRCESSLAIMIQCIHLDTSCLNIDTLFSNVTNWIFCCRNPMLCCCRKPTDTVNWYNYSQNDRRRQLWRHNRMTLPNVLKDKFTSFQCQLIIKTVALTSSFLSMLHHHIKLIVYNKVIPLHTIPR